MRVRVLGAAAGGGFPQWNCGCRGCTLARRGVARARTQDSIAVSADGERWVLFNASPDVLRQIESTRELWPRDARQSPIVGVVVTNGDVDHVAGLLSLRERHPLVVASTARVFGGLFEKNVLLRTLQRFDEHLRWERLSLDETTALAGLEITPIAAPGKTPVHLGGEFEPEDNVGVLIRANGRSVAYVPSAGAIGDLRARVEDVDALLFDGTFWSSDELIAQGLGLSTAESMAHLPIQRSLAAFEGKRIYTHINNSNPILIERSAERRAVEAAGWQVAFDGMEVL